MLPQRITAWILFFSSLSFVQLQQRQLLLLLCQWRRHLVRLQLVLEYHNIIVRRRTKIVMQHTEVRILHLHRSIAAQTCNYSGGVRTEILRQKVEIKFSWLTFSYKSWRVNWQIWQISRLIKIVLLSGRTTASLKFGKPFGRPKVCGSKYHRAHLSRGISDGFFRKINKNLPSASGTYAEQFLSNRIEKSYPLMYLKVIYLNSKSSLVQHTIKMIVVYSGLES